MPRFTKCFEIMVATTLWEKPRISNAKTERQLMSPGKPLALGNMHSSYELSNLCCE